MLDISTPEINLETRPRIVVIGVGGAGGNAVENMINQNLEGCEFLVANTDAQALKYSSCDKHIQLGAIITKGLGAGANPEVGRKAAEESVEQVVDFIDGANMVFIACGMGGGTGTGAAPIIARHAREKGILTVGVVTKPFEFEGSRRMKQANAGIIELQKFVDTLIVIPNQNLFYQTSETTSISEAFQMVDDVLHRGVSGVTDLMIKPGLINLDFNDIRTVMSEMGKAMMGTGEATTTEHGTDRAFIAAENSINNKLLDDDNMKGATAALVNITASKDVSLTEVTTAVSRIRQELAEDAHIIFGTTIDETIGDNFRVSIVATGIDVTAQNNHTSDAVNLDIERPQPDILFGEKTETSDSFLNALQSNGSTENSVGVQEAIHSSSNEPSPEASAHTMADTTNYAPNSMNEAPDFFSQEDPQGQHTQNTPDHAQHAESEMNAIKTEIIQTELPSLTVEEKTPAPTMDPFFEADLANASHSPETSNNTVVETISEGNVEKGGFFKRLFGGIKATNETVERIEPVLEPQDSKAQNTQSQPNPQETSSATRQESDDINLAVSSQQKSDDDLDIPAFLRKQIN